MSERRQHPRRVGPGTLLVQSGRGRAADTHAHILPIFQTSAYLFDDVAHGQALYQGEAPGYIYGRLGNPNTQATAETIAALEGINLPERPFGLLTGSGMAAVSTVLLALTEPGETVISQDALYGATHKILKTQMPRHGVQHEMFYGPDLASLEAALDRSQKVRLVYIESPTNPTLALTDVRGVVERAHAAGAWVVMDNTFATPILQRPLEMGVDVALHSTTKYLTGHGTVVGGAIVTRHEALYRERLRPTLELYGAVAGPMDAWLTGQGLKTLHLRMARHCENALAVARFLEGHPAVTRVNYPGLESFPQRDLARAQMDGCGGMLSFELKGGYEAGVALMNAVRVCTLTASLGTVDTLISHPASMTHITVPPEDRVTMGITDGLVRLSVGLEDAADILADLEEALATG